MTNKERLEDIKHEYDFLGVLHRSEHIEWLIEQAERAQELEEELNKQLETGYKIECHLYESNKQNKRYREAFKQIKLQILFDGAIEDHRKT